MTSAAELFAMERATLNGSVLLWTPDGWRLAVSAFDPFAGAPMADEDPVECGQHRKLKPCGTYASYKRHKRHGEEPCEPCKFAMRRYCADGERRRYAAASTSASTPVHSHDVHTPLLVTPAGAPMLISVAGQRETAPNPVAASTSTTSPHDHDNCQQRRSGLTA